MEHGHDATYFSRLPGRNDVSASQCIAVRPCRSTASAVALNVSRNLGHKYVGHTTSGPKLRFVGLSNF